MREKCLICSDPVDSGNICDSCSRDALVIDDGQDIGTALRLDPFLPEGNRKERRAAAAVRRRKWRV